MDPVRGVAPRVSPAAGSPTAPLGADLWSSAPSPADLAPADVLAASGPILRHLQQRTGLALWVLARLRGDEWLVLDSADHGYGVRPGATYPWEATLCSRMVAGLGPRVAPRAADIPAYAAAPVRAQLPIASYIGVPLLYAGELVGTLSAFDPAPRDDDMALLLREVELMAGMLATILGQSLRAADLVRRADRAELEAHVDALTQLGNRLAWQKVLAEEEARCARYGRTACVISVDLDHLKRVNDSGGHVAGDRLLRDAAVVIRRASRLCDQVARVGGDEFAVLAVESDLLGGHAILARIQDSLAGAGIEASLGIAARVADSDLERTWQEADAAMYEQKRSRRRQRVRDALAQESSGALPRARVELVLPEAEYTA